jgi:hypothetical protein
LRGEGERGGRRKTEMANKRRGQDIMLDGVRSVMTVPLLDVSIVSLLLSPLFHLFSFSVFYSFAITATYQLTFTLIQHHSLLIHYLHLFNFHPLFISTFIPLAHHTHYYTAHKSQSPHTPTCTHIAPIHTQPRTHSHYPHSLSITSLLSISTL